MENIPPFCLGLLAVFDPDRGHGITESIIAVLIVGSVMGLLFFNIEVPTWLVGTFTLISGVWLGGQVQSNAQDYRRKK